MPNTPCEYPSNLAFEIEVATDLASLIDSPRGLTVLLLIQYEEWEQLLALDFDPANYVDRDSFADDYLISKLLTKSVNIPTNIDKAGVALEKFFEGEQICRETNDRIESGCLDSLLHDLRAVVASIVGPLRHRDLLQVASGFRNGPGATFGMAGTGSCPSDKFRDTPTLTYSLIPFARSILGDRLMDAHAYLEVVQGNRFTTVPKTALTDRGICIEPSVNVFTQLGIGALIRKRLHSHHIDLNDQRVNQSFAERAQKAGFVTIDLSLASDSVSLLLVNRLFSREWFELLNLSRSPNTLLPDGTIVPLEKFSSMGNGYTFELESLIFAAVCKYAGCNLGIDSSVYGDDLIVPCHLADRVIRTLALIGFKVNSSKTFLAGRFFESCGTDWFDSVPVRPFFLRKQPSNKIPYAVYVCNRLRLYAKQRGIIGCDSRFRTLWRKYYAMVPKAWRHPVPEEFGDTGVIVSDLEHKNPRPAFGEEGTYVRSVIMRPRKRRNDDYGLLLHHLHSLSLRATGLRPMSADGGKGSLDNYEIIRGYLGKPRTVRSISRYCDDLRWVV